MQAKPATAPFTAQKLQTIAAELMPFLELVRELDGKDFCIPTDRLIRTSDAAKILGVSKATIVAFEEAKASKTKLRKQIANLSKRKATWRKFLIR